MEDLRASLDLYEINTLWSIAEALGIRAEAPRPTKANLIKQLLQEIPRRAATPSFIKALSEAERAVLALVLKHGGQARVMDLLAPLLLKGVLPATPADSADVLRQRFHELLLPLLRYGLLINLTTPPYGTRRKFEPLTDIGMAPQVAHVLPRKLLTLPATDLQRFVVPEPALIKNSDPEMLVRQCFFVWSGLLHTPARQLKSGQISKVDLRRLANELGWNLKTDERKLRLVIAMLHKAHLLHSSQGTFRATDDERAQHLWQQDLSTQVRELLMAFLNLDDSFEHSEIDTTVYIPAYGFAYQAVKPFRILNQQLFAILQQLPPASWFPLSILAFLLNGGQAGGFIYVSQMLNALEQQVQWAEGRYSANPSLMKLKQQLEQVETAVLQALLEDWCWLGVIELGYHGQPSSLQALRLTDMGCAIFQQTTLAPSSEGGQLVLQPDFQLLALGPVSLSILVAIERIAQRETVQEAAVGYRLTRDSIYRALQQGASIGSICAFLRQITGQPLPQNVERTLEEWGGQHERIVVRRNVLVLQTNTPEQLEQLLADTVLKGLLQRVDAHTALANAQHLPKLRERLWELQILPAISKGPEADLPHSLLWEDEEGRLLPRTSPPSLYVSSLVSQFAMAEGSGWRLTPASVREAAQRGFSAPEMLAQIERLTGTVPSPEWQKRLKAWSRHYGDARLRQVYLLRLENAETLADLRSSDRQLSRWLRPLEENNALAIVDERHLDEVLALLTALGVNVTTER